MAPQVLTEKIPNQTPKDLARVVLSSAGVPAVLLTSQGRKQHLLKIEFTYVFLSHIEGCLWLSWKMFKRQFPKN